MRSYLPRNSVYRALPLLPAASWLALLAGLIGCLDTAIVVTPALQAIVINPNTAQVLPQQTIQLKATINYSDGTSKDGSSGLTWQSSNEAVITVDRATGLAQAIATGTATITASVASIQGKATITVPGNDAILVGLTITPAAPTVAVGNSLPLVATGLFRDGSTRILTEQVQWLASNPNVATIDPRTGIVTGIEEGQATWLATLEGVGSSVTGTITPAVATLKSIASFSFTQANNSDLTSTVIGQQNGSNITLVVPFGTNVSDLLPTITHSGASITPAANVRRNFSTPQSYTVTAQDGTSKIYTVTVQIAADSSKQITNFTIGSTVGTIAGNSINLTMPAGTDANTLVPTITFAGSYVLPASGVAQNFSQPIDYIVAAADGSLQTYTVTVTVALATTKAITSFAILGVQGTILGNNIAIQLPENTSLLTLTPTIVSNGATVSPATGIARNFTNPVTYTVTAEDGSTNVYTVTASVALSSSKTITAFSLLGVAGTIVGTDISLQLPFGTDITNLTPTITHTGAAISPLATVARNFSTQLSYTVTAANGTSQVYNVQVTVAANPAKQITSFALLGQAGQLGGNTISFLLPAGTSLTNLTPAIVHTGASISPSAATPQNFTNPITYTVTAADASQQSYTVQVNLAAASANNITSFAVLGNQATIQGNAISVSVPFGTSLTNLQPTIEIDGSSVTPASGVGQDFTNPVTYTVQAADSSTKAYTVNVTPTAQSNKEITSFRLLGNNGTIIGNAIALTVPFGTDIGNLAPTIAIRGQFVSPDTGESQDFRSPVTYTVTAADNSTATYTVNVAVAANSAKDILSFEVLGLPATITSNTIQLTVPFGTNITALTPKISSNGTNVTPGNLAVQDFTNAVTYTVTAANNSTKTYTATINVASNSAKDISSFQMMGIDGVILGTDISLTLPFGTILTALTPTITHSGASISPVSGASRDFSAPVVYTVTAADATTKTYTVTVQTAPNPAKNILTFEILGVPGTIGMSTVDVTLPFGTALTALTPTITHSGASINPVSGASGDFSAPVVYTVTAADTTTKTYTVTVQTAPNPAKDMLTFSILGVPGTVGLSTVDVTLPFGTALTALTPTITHSGASISPASLVSGDFSAPVVYTVTAADATTKTYTVTVQTAPNPAKDILTFEILGVPGTIGMSTVAITLPFGTILTALTPTITHSGASISPASLVSGDFSAPVVYTVTAADATTKTYTVTVQTAPNPAKDILTFEILGVPGTIGVNTVAITLPFGTGLTALTPTITHSGASISPASLVSGDFSAPVVYTVTAADATTKTYTVTVQTAPNPAKDILTFEILGVPGTIGANTVAITLPFGTVLTALTPTITHSGASISPASLVSGDFSAPVVYTVTAADATTKTYTVTVQTAPNPAKDILAFEILGVPGTIGANTVAITLPFGTGLTALTPTITHSGASISPASLVSGDFSAPVVYTVTAADATTKTYTVTVQTAPNPAKDILTFEILGVPGTIGMSTVAITLPFGTILTALTPTITHSGASISPASLVSGDFSAPVVYTVTAADATTKTYTVTVQTAPNPAKNILTFEILGVPGTIGANMVDITLPFGTVLTALTPTITHSGASISPASLVSGDFSAPVVYTVTAADATTKTYTVTVQTAPNPAKDILTFEILGVPGTIGMSTVAITLPFGTVLTALTPTITHSGASISPASLVSEDFSAPVVYTVTAADATTKTYTVTVQTAPNPAKDILTFEILGVPGTIGANTVAITLPFGTVLTALTPTITHSGASISPASLVSEDFSAPVVYTVTAADTTTKTYTVTVQTAPNPAKDILTFAILGVPGTIGVDSVDLTLPYGTALTALTPTITHSGASISPASGASGDFSVTVVYTVTAADNSTKTYNVNVTAALDASCNINQFTIGDYFGTINYDTITITLPNSTGSLDAVSPLISIDGVTVTPDSGDEVDLTDPVTYTVTAESGDEKTYTVTATIAGPTDKDITAVSYNGYPGTIMGTNIAITIPYNSPLTAIAPLIQHQGDAILPALGLVQDFSMPVDYTVSDNEAGPGTKVYTITINQALQNANDIVLFAINGVAGTIVGTTITVALPEAIDVISLRPTIAHLGTTIEPSSSAFQNFTNPVSYKVTADDASEKTYTVTVTTP